MMDQKNLLLAIVISVVILVGFQYGFQFLSPPHKEAPVAAQTPAPAPAPGSPAAQSSPSQAPVPGATSGPAITPTPGTPQSRAQVESREQALTTQPRLKIDTPRLHGSIALTGGRLDDLTLATYHDTVDPKSPEVVLLEPTGTKDPYFAEFGWVAESADEKAKLPGPTTLWQGTGTLTPTTPVTLTWNNGEGLIFTRTIAVDPDYMFTVKESVKNTGGAPVNLIPYGLISRAGTPEVSGYSVLHEGLAGYLGGETLGVRGWFTDPDSYAKLLPGAPLELASKGGWLGFTDKYWLTALVPPQREQIKGKFQHTVDAGTDRYQADYLGAPVAIAPGGDADTTTRFFAGAKEVNLLDAYTKSGIPNFDTAIDFGHFYFLTKPIFLALQFIYKVIGNFGLAILLFTLLVKLCFFPLANKSYRAMSKMKLLQPQMQKIREQYPDDKQKQQTEIMAMYKRVGANPLAGCLPIVIQVPVFYSLYKVLFVTIEMRHAPFYGWIHDLSAPDPTSFANLFGLLPFTPPHILMIGAWPLIMGLTMFLQQKLNPQPVDPVQAKMFMVLPIVFTYMLSAFPAGLVIYWAWNNTLSVAQQWVIMHRAGAA